MTYPIPAIAVAGVASLWLATLTAGLIFRLGFPLPSASRRLGCVDGLRGYLAISVLIHHFTIWMQIVRLGGEWQAPSVNFFNQLGAGAVALFFMTTGFVFYPRVLSGFRACSWGAVYTTRLFRIVPLVAFSVAIITLIIGLRTGRALDSAFPLAAVKWIATWFSPMHEPPLLGFADSGRLNAYVLWSLSYEWLFYLFVLPGCALAMDLTRGVLPSWATPVFLLALSLAARAFHLASFAPFFLWLPLFAIGMIAYECQRREWLAQRFRTNAAGAGAVVAMAIGMLSTSTPYTFALPLFGFFFICVACGNNLGGVLTTKGALVLGECSYGVYLLHGVLLNLLFVSAAGATKSIATDFVPAFLPVAAIIITVVTSGTYLLIERPAIRIGSRLAKRLDARRLTNAEVEVAP